jgi:hypothetical protein
LEQIQQKFKENLPPNLTNLTGIPIPNNLDLENATDDAKKVFKDKCIKVSGSDAAYEEAVQGSQTLVECLKELIDFETLNEEIDKAMPTGDLDTVFNKYCRKRNTALECVKNFTNSVEPCLEEEERKQKTVFFGIFEKLLEFVCHKDGDQIALFIAEKGPECFTSKQDQLQDCINSTLHHYIPSEGLSLENLPNLILTEKECNDMENLQKCIVRELEKCEESTPANLMESLFKFVKNETVCANVQSSLMSSTNTSPNYGSINSILFNVLTGTWLMVLMAKFLTF